MKVQTFSRNLSESYQPCALKRSQVDGSSLKVPYARGADGIARHVSEVSGRHDGPFNCLECKGPLSFREYRNKRTHFAHHPDSSCSGETALHIYAKELLRREKRILLPPLVLHEERLAETVFEGGIFHLDKVEIEQSQGDFQPDAVVHIGDNVRAVEFKVSHAVDDEKLAKVISRNMPMIEIDLGHLRPGNFDAAALDDEILEKAPRFWIHHPDRIAGKKRLAARVGSLRKERGRKLKWHIEKKPMRDAPPDWVRELKAIVFDASLQDLVGLDVDCSHWFTVNSTLWQAAVLNVLIIEPSVTYSPGKDLKIKGEWPNEHLLESAVPEWLIRDDLSNYPLNRLNEAGFSQESYGSAHEGVLNYLWELSARDDIVYWDREWECFRVDPELHGRLHRRQEIRRKVAHILDSSKIQSSDFNVEAWMSDYVVDRQYPEAIAVAGGSAYVDLIVRISNISSMVHAYYGHDIVDDLCGLPLETLLSQRLQEKANAEAKREEEKIAAIASRRHSLQNAAIYGLESEAIAWLNSIVPTQSEPIITWASESDEALSRARHLLFDATQEKKQCEREAQATLSLQEKLMQAARKAFPDKAHADLFLRTAHPRIGGQRPIEYCTNPAALTFLKGLLPGKRK